MKKDSFEPGDLIQVTTLSEEIKGTFLPSNNKEMLSLKLPSGYNLSIKKSEIKAIKILEKHIPKIEKTTETKIRKELPTIIILHTGGTISSKVSYKTGAVSAQFLPQDIINKFPKLKEIANIESRLISNMFSENIRFHHYNLMAKEIEKEINSKVDGIILTHGTDTLHYTAAALSFILEDLPIPVILVGSQRSSDRPSSDASLNLISSARFIKETDFAGVAICMHQSIEDKNAVILPACKTRKVHTSRRDAFKPINSSPIAIISEKIEFLTKDYSKKENKKLKLKTIKEKLKIGILKAHPNMLSREIENYNSFDALIIEGTGLGHIAVEKIDSESSENEKILNSIKKLSKKMPIIMTSQCIFGRINMDVYSPGRKLQEAGVINNNSDITTETAFIKAAWLLSNHKKEFYELWNKDLRGEINNRLLPEHYLDDTN
ncbi:Glu-tRNA(Gln) amidotransferase subunit GatD [Candidatus Woesearchaeota archaeon]|nr:Glu-tRNA(Gln) amidotransferase subunit GatD [Candidatus Woesearchaeota archaeon]